MTEIDLNQVDVPLSSNETDQFVDEEQSDGDIFNNEHIPKFLTRHGRKGSFRYRIFAKTRPCNKREIGLIFISCIVLVVLIILAVLLISYHRHWRNLPDTTHNNEDIQVCDSSTCVMAAGNIIKKMNTSVDPCQDFYQYACGHFIADTPMPPGHTRWGLFSEIAKRNNFIIKKAVESTELLLKSSSSTTLLPAVVNAVHLYQSCMNLTVIEAKQKQPLTTLFQKLQPWPITFERYWNPEKWDFQKALMDSHYLGGGGLFLIFPGNDPGNSSRNILHASQSGLGLPSRRYYLSNSSLLSQYEKYMVNILTLLESKQSADKINQLAKKVIQLEIQLAKEFRPPEDMMADQTYHLSTVQDLIAMCPIVPWIQYISNTTNMSISNETIINIKTPSYFRHLGQIIAQTDKETMSTYLMWGLINSVTDLLSEPFREADRKFSLAFNGGDPSARQPRWETCLGKVNYYFGKVTGRMFVDSHFQGSSKDQAIDMISGIRKAFINNLPTVKWMDSTTAVSAVEKAKAIISLIGYPDWILNDERLNSYYSGTTTDSKQFFDNIINLRIFSNYKAMSSLKKTTNRHKWFMEPFEVNAYFEQSFNDIVFPAGILQEPFFHKDYPKYLNYGGIGVAMGHELTHGFDSSGRKFDATGKLKSWWEPKANAAFNEHAKCMITQYSKYRIDNVNINGNLTITENIADNGGLKIAYNSYQKWKNAHEREPQLPGLKYSPNQMLFIAFAQIWCTLETPKTAHQMILIDRHSSAKYRVIGTLSNSKEFAEAFNCRTGTPMNPKKKCRVW